MARSLHLWIVFFNPADFPGKFVVRIQEIRPGVPEPIRLGYVWIRDSLEAARGCIPPGLFRIARDPSDPPQIVETWL